MILEGIVTTRNEDGTTNIAPMGPIVEPDMRRFVLRPFQPSTTYQNLKRSGEGVLHVTDDVLLLAKGAIGQRIDARLRPADHVQGDVLLDACRYYEFRVSRIEDQEPRTTIAAETVAQGHLRDFFGLNRAKHAVVEAAILATRTDFLPIADILAEYQKLAILVDKTGGAAEHEAFFLLHDYVRKFADSRSAREEAGPR